ncbi:MAG TPA: hypothetical protein P5567_12680 [Kiritimatiellia bacterium]|nr:hypothetical protein [Kiritimatiellia bacterium]HRZ13297.1 hypothetical protein [Kiritimatiellia bacterium]HSA18746.1 hypothetical protein [Kiritimatiellia bacterium]
MKTIIMTGVVLLLGLAAGAQHVPDRLNYQAVLTDEHGNPRASVTNGVRFRIYDEAEGGNLIWGEKHSVTTTPLGLFNVVLGNGIALGETMEAATLREAFASGTLVEQRYLELQSLNDDGSAQSPILPRQRFLTVPYVFQANDAQEAAGDFQVSGALYSTRVGMEVGRLVATNPAGSITVAGDLRVDGYGHSDVTATFSSNSSVKSTAPDALIARSNLTVNAAWTVAGTATFYRGVSARDPILKKGARVRGGVRALGSYQSLGTTLTNLSSRTAAGDGFALVYFKTDGWGDNADLVVTVKTNQYRLQHNPSSGAAHTYDLHYLDTACIPIPSGSVWSVNFQDGNASHSKFDAYWIPFGY